MLEVAVLVVPLVRRKSRANIILEGGPGFAATTSDASTADTRGDDSSTMDGADGTANMSESCTGGGIAVAKR